MNWEVLGVIVTLLVLGVPVLRQLSSCVANLDNLEEHLGTHERQWERCRDEDRADHADFRETIQGHGVQLQEHEHRITSLEAE